MFKLDIDDTLSLALVQPSFAVDYLAIVSRDRDYLAQWLVWPEHGKNQEFFARFIEQSLHDYALGKSMTCGIVFKGELVGNISFNTINHSLKKVEIGYWLSRPQQGKGIVTKAVAKMIEIAFTQLNMEKAQISAAEQNSPSRRVCERLGFTLEGIITRAENLNGRVVDHAIYGLSREIWSEQSR
ncbi:GNAT family N-acetyltransferase [Vibrio wakamikoensis]|jgi:ribosomal-protein-serine acetyltransferase|uniref:GNAT family protein n=1 Tax=Vibrio chaetopteri TaxID=3016528 RepID=A0AAU8BQ36_9VIBR